MVRPSILAVALALGLAACTPAASPYPKPTPDTALIAVPTQGPEPPGSPAACPAALIEGRLSADERWGVALLDTSGLLRKVVWPHGFAAQRSIGGLLLLDADGKVVAHTGDLLRIGGGEVGPDGSWLACGGIRRIES